MNASVYMHMPDSEVHIHFVTSDYLYPSVSLQVMVNAIVMEELRRIIETSDVRKYRILE